MRTEATGLGDIRRERAASLGLQQLEVLGRERRDQRLNVGLPVHQCHAVVLQALADREVLANVDLEQRQLIRRPDAGEHQQLRGLIGADREDDLAGGLHRLDRSRVIDLHPCCTVTVEQDTQRVRVGDDSQVLAPHRWMQVVHRGACAASPSC